jgi:hypothetical protein
VVVEVAQVVVAVTALNQVLKAQLVVMAVQVCNRLLTVQQHSTHQAVVVALLALTGQLPQEQRLLVAAAPEDQILRVQTALQIQVAVVVVEIVVVVGLAVLV